MESLVILPTVADCLNKVVCNGKIAELWFDPPSPLPLVNAGILWAPCIAICHKENENPSFFGGQFILGGTVRREGRKAKRGRRGSHTNIRDYISFEEKWETLVTFVLVNPADLEWVILSVNFLPRQRQKSFLRAMCYLKTIIWDWQMSIIDKVWNIHS